MPTSLSDMDYLAPETLAQALEMKSALGAEAMWLAGGTDLVLRARQRRGAAVVSRAGHVLGIVTVSDFVRHAENLPQGALGERLRQLMTPTTTLESDKPEVAGQIMSRPVITACSDQRLAELVPVFINRNIHHLPVVDARDRLVGMIAWEDVLALTEKGPAPQPV